MERDLRAFLAVARAGNLTAAAEAIGLTQPALTKTIRRVELEFGAPLFERVARGMVLTACGEMLVERARAIEMHHRQAREEIAAHRSGVLAEFRIAAGPAYHAAIAPSLAKALAVLFPSTHLKLMFEVSDVAMPKLGAGELDLVLGAAASTPTEGIETLPLFDVETAVWACRGDPLARASHVAPSALKDRQWIVYRQDRRMVSRLEIFHANHFMPKPRIVMEIDSMMGSFRAVSGTPYLTAAATKTADLAEAAGLARLRLDAPVWTFVSGAWYRGSQRKVPILRKALELLIEATADRAASLARS